MLVTDPALYLRVSHELVAFLKRIVVEEVLRPQDLYSPDGPLTMISLIPRSSTSVGEVSLFVDAKNNVETQFFYLPIDSIQSSDDYTESFVLIFFGLLETVLTRKGIQNVNYDFLIERTFHEISDNPRLYAYVEPDDNGLGNILDELGLE